MAKKVTIILIAGGSASGKTTVANRLANEILKDKSVTHLKMDHYYKDFPNLSFKQVKQLNFDHPKNFDLPLLLADLKTLLAYQPIHVAKYDFKTWSRTNQIIEYPPSDVVILDGIFTLAIKEIRDLGHIKIFIKTADDLRFIRRMQRDVHERQRELDEIVHQYLTEVKPMHDAFIEPSIEYADLIVPYREGNEVAVDLVATKILSLVNR